MKKISLIFVFLILLNTAAATANPETKCSKFQVSVFTLESGSIAHIYHVVEPVSYYCNKPDFDAQGHMKLMRMEPIHSAGPRIPSLRWKAI